MTRSYKAPGSELFQALWETQAGHCALCGTPMLRNRFEAAHATLWAKYRATFDHIRPKSKGGSDQPENLQLAHARCNKIKGNRL
ncbi:MAG: HNH endonuclease signature motif containing protein [Pseudomonadota bacterium]